MKIGIAKLLFDSDIRAEIFFLGFVVILAQYTGNITQYLHVLQANKTKEQNGKEMSQLTF